MCFAKVALLGIVLALLGGCGDNLIPSGDDRRPPVQSGSVGSEVGQNAPGFSVSDTGGATVTLPSALAAANKGVVLYFTMWCPSCDLQTSQLQAVIPSFPGVGFYLVDYVSGSVAEAGAAALANGYTGVGFITLADTGHQLLNGLRGTMGTTVVIDAAGVIRLNEDYRDGARLKAVLAALP
jgi:peroxiredoxin